MTLEEKTIFDALSNMITKGSPKVPDIEQVRTVSKASKMTREKVELNRELNILTAKIYARASCGNFNLGDSVSIRYSENVDALKDAGYTLVPIENNPNFYEVSWDAAVTDDGASSSDGEGVEVTVSAESGIAGGDFDS
jgi:hypothetical protein